MIKTNSIFRPSLAFCLPMPFSEEKLRDLSVSSELASFLLYTFSPYYPNPDILDKPELLKDLTRQFRTFVSRSRQGNIKQPGIFVEILLKAVSIGIRALLGVWSFSSTKNATWLQEFDEIITFFCLVTKPEWSWSHLASYCSGIVISILEGFLLNQ